MSDAMAVTALGRTAPRVRAMVNGATIGCLRAEVRTNGYQQADSYEVTLLPDSPYDAGSGRDAAWWGASARGTTGNQVVVTVQVDPGTAGTPNWTTLIVGKVDHMTFDPAEGTLELQGRDLTADLIETETAEAFVNQKSSEVATLIAQRHGLTPVVTPTPDPVDRFYPDSGRSSDHTKHTAHNFHKETNEWELLCRLARLEGYDVFIRGTSLYFQPKAETVVKPYVITLDTKSKPWLIANGYNIKLQRSLALAKDIVVTYESYHSRFKAAYSATARSSHTGAASLSPSVGSKNETTQFTFTVPNRNQVQLEALAIAKANELSQHERVVHVSMPGEVSLVSLGGLRITGTGTSYDQDYYITEITRSISYEGGFTQSVVAKNQSPRDVGLDQVV